MDDELLTELDREPLLAMVRFQRQQGQNVQFTIPLGGLLIKHDDKFHVLPPKHARELWEEQKYVKVTTNKIYLPTVDYEVGRTYIEGDGLILTLTQKALVTNAG